MGSAWKFCPSLRLSCRAESKWPSQMNSLCFTNTFRTISHDAEASATLNKGFSASHHKYLSSPSHPSQDRVRLSFIKSCIRSLGFSSTTYQSCDLGTVSFSSLMLIFSTARWIDKKATWVDCMLICVRQYHTCKNNWCPSWWTFRTQILLVSFFLCHSVLLWTCCSLYLVFNVTSSNRHPIFLTIAQWESGAPVRCGLVLGARF